MNIGWICLSGIVKSETFLSDTLDSLRTFANVRAVSGVSEGKHKSDPDHVYVPFAEHHLSLRHRLHSRLVGMNVHRREVQKRCLRMAAPVFEAFQPDLFWVEFGTTAVVAKLLLERERKPFVIAVHGYDITTELKDAAYKMELISMMNSGLCIGVVCASHYTKRLCVLAGVEASKMQVIRLGLDGEKIKPSGVTKTLVPSFVHFGRLVEKKNPLATLEAFRVVLQKFPESIMTFVGDGPLLAELQERVRTYGLDQRVNLMGALDRKEAVAIVESHWVFVQHSVTARTGDQEGFALSPAEAALLELPVVSTLHNGIPEHVLHGETGYLVPEFDYEEMAARMIELAGSEKLRRKLGSNGRVNVLSLCDPKHRVEQLQNFLEV